MRTECPSCDGTGQVAEAVGHEDGSTRVKVKPCGACGGSGWTDRGR